MITLGEKIQLIRRRKGINQRELAKILCTSHTTISKVENGYRELNHSEILSWASALGIKPEALLMTTPNSGYTRSTRKVANQDAG